jgi:hypothetical protein
VSCITIVSIYSLALRQSGQYTRINCLRHNVEAQSARLIVTTCTNDHFATRYARSLAHHHYHQQHANLLFTAKYASAHTCRYLCIAQRKYSMTAFIHPSGSSRPLLHLVHQQYLAYAPTKDNSPFNHQTNNPYAQSIPLHRATCLKERKMELNKWTPTPDRIIFPRHNDAGRPDRLFAYHVYLGPRYLATQITRNEIPLPHVLCMGCRLVFQLSYVFSRGDLWDGG